MKTSIIILLLTLTGCANTHSFVASAAEKASGAADIYLDDLEFGMCKTVTIGAWMRRYGNDPIKAAAWREICKTNNTESPGK